MDNRMTSHFNQLTEAKDERLTLLSEECSEVIQAICKIQRHGYEGSNPDIPSPSPDNRALLAKEISHVMLVIHMMTEVRDVTKGSIALFRRKKVKSIGQWLHHQEGK